MTTVKGSPTLRRIAGAGVIGLGFTLAGLNGAQALADKTPQMCPDDLDPFPELNEVMNPCITELTQKGSALHVAWDGLQDRTYYEVSWQITPPGQRPGPDTYQEPPHRVGGARFGAFDIPNVQPDKTYWVKLLGCSPSMLAAGACQLSAVKAVTTK